MEEQLPRRGFDELNVTEFPIAVLLPPRNPVLELSFLDGQKEWTLQGVPPYYLPTYEADIPVYLALMAQGQVQGFPAKMPINRYELLGMMGIAKPSGRDYARLKLSLDRWSTLTIQAKHAFHDARRPERMKEETIRFHILDGYRLVDEKESGRPVDDKEPHASWIRWGSEFHSNLIRHYVKPLDLGLYRQLERTIAQALYRYLDGKRYDGKPFYRIGLKKLAFEHIGLSRKYYPSQIKNKLEPAHEELIAAGFIAGFEYAPMRSGDEMVTYRFPRRELPSGTCTTKQPEPPLIDELTAAGITLAVARELAAADPAECRRQLDYLPARKARHPGALLTKSIRESWAAPEPEAPRKRLLVRKSAEAVPIDADFLAWWDTLPLEERGCREQEALESLPGALRDLARRCPDSAAVRGAVRELLRNHYQTWKEPTDV